MGCIYVPDLCNPDGPTTQMMTNMCLRLSTIMSCFKECGLDCEFSSQQLGIGPEILCLRTRQEDAWVWGVLWGTEGMAGLTTSFHSLLAPSAPRDACLTDRATACPPGLSWSSPRKGTGAQGQPGRPPGRLRDLFHWHIFFFFI